MGDGISNKVKIVRALAGLLEEKSLDSVSVSEICVRADISRQTFYRCFNDKYAIAIWYNDSVIDATARQVGRTLGWRDGYLSTFRILERSAAFMRGVSQSRDYNSVFMTTIRSSAQDFSLAYQDRMGHAPEGIVAYQIHVFSRVATECISEWIEGGCVLSAEEFIDYFISLVPRDLYDALEMESTRGCDPSGVFLVL